MSKVDVSLKNDIVLTRDDYRALKLSSDHRSKARRCNKIL